MDITSLLKPKTTIILAVSGGPDSVFLLYESLKWQKRLRLKLVVAHLNHNLRGTESDKDAIFVKKLVEKLNQKLNPDQALLFAYDQVPANKRQSEETLRKLRYKFLKKIRQKYNAEWIITAHHLNDNIETLLFQICRGTFINGLVGIASVDEKRHLLRPFLHLTKEEILKKLKTERITYREDSSNKWLQFSRNRIRQKIVPEFKKINPAFERTMGITLQNFTEIKDYLQSEISQWLKLNYQKNKIDQQAFLKLHPLLQKEVLAEIYRQLYGNTEKFNQSHLQQILKVIRTPKAGNYKEFGPKYWIGTQKDASTNKRSIIIKKRSKAKE